MIKVLPPVGRFGDNINYELAVLRDCPVWGCGLSSTASWAQTLTAGPTLTRVVDRLVTQALGYREGDQFDRRKVRVFLGERGTDLHHRLRRRIAPVQAQWAASNWPQLCDRLAPPADDA